MTPCSVGESKLRLNSPRFRICINFSHSGLRYEHGAYLWDVLSNQNQLNMKSKLITVLTEGSFSRHFIGGSIASSFLFISDPDSSGPFPFRSIPSNHLPSTKRRFVGSACTAPTEGLSPSYLQHWSSNYLNQSIALFPFRAHTCK